MRLTQVAPRLKVEWRLGPRGKWYPGWIHGSTQETAKSMQDQVSKVFSLSKTKSKSVYIVAGFKSCECCESPVPRVLEEYPTILRSKWKKNRITSMYTKLSNIRVVADDRDHP